MAVKRLLLPFTWGVDEQAITTALRFAKASEVVLVALALIPVSNGNGKSLESVRPEHIQQAQDFLETIAARAPLYSVTVERLQSFTSSLVESIHTTLQQTESHGLLLLSTENRPCLLHAEEVKQIRNGLRVNIYDLYIPPQKKAKKTFSLH